MNPRLHIVDRRLAAEQRSFWDRLQSRRATEGQVGKAVEFETRLIDEHASAYLEEFGTLLSDLEIPVSGDFYRAFFRDVLAPVLSGDIRAAQKRISIFFGENGWTDAEIRGKRYEWEIKLDGLAQTQDIRADERRRSQNRLPSSRGRGRPSLIADEIVIMMGSLYIKLLAGRAYLPLGDLREIALELDAAGISPKKKESGLPQSIRKAILGFNSRCGKRKERNINTFAALVKVGKVREPVFSLPSEMIEVDLIKAFRKTLRSCAKIVEAMGPSANLSVESAPFAGDKAESVGH
jgi:hypothetical protein